MNALVFGLLASFFGLMMIVDARQIDFQNVWVKPFKFAVSIAVFFLSLGLIWPWLRLDRKKSSLLTNLFLNVMWLEIILISCQAFRGVQSHFNISTTTDSIIFGSMGVAILISTIAIFYLWLRAFKLPLTSSIQRIVLIWGFGTLLMGSVIGGLMSGMLTHSIGVIDHSKDLPITGWSTTSGDLRVAHFLGIHSFQILLILSAFSGFRKRPTLLKSMAVLLFLLTITLFIQALMGIPVIQN